MRKTLDDILNPARPAGAYDDLLAEVLPTAKAQRAWEPADGALPALFVSHGAPPTLDDSRWLRDLFDWGQSLPKPRGIVIVSAHWENAPLAITNAAAGTPLYYDFGGFHPRYYTLQYRTPDATALARRVAGTFSDTTTQYHANRGLDHGAFIPLMAMYPAADVPVVQVSMPSLDPQALLTLGQRLKSMRQEGYLVIGSGFMTHSFATMRRPELMGYNRDFDAWAADAIARRDVDALVDFRAKGPGSEVAHPTSDHFVPLLLTLGAGDDESQVPTSVIARETMWNSIRSIQAA
jgi:4,5-DOPA dioxygenase extradiol